MSKNCSETKQTLITPHIELELINRRGSGGFLEVNVAAFEKTLDYVLPPSAPTKGPLIPETPYFRVYGTVGRIVNTHRFSYLNIDEPPISRTLIGYLTIGDVEKNLPNTFAKFNVELF